MVWPTHTDVFPVVASLYPKSNVCEPDWPNDFCDVGHNHPDNSLALKIKELTRETSRKIVPGGYVYKSKVKGRRSLCIAAPSIQEDAFCQDCGTD